MKVQWQVMTDKADWKLPLPLRPEFLRRFASLDPWHQRRPEGQARF